jgi:hypothetical protein
MNIQVGQRYDMVKIRGKIYTIEIFEIHLDELYYFFLNHDIHSIDKKHKAPIEDFIFANNNGSIKLDEKYERNRKINELGI